MAARRSTCWPVPPSERYREANGLEPEIREGLYPGDYLIPVGEALKAKYGDSLLDRPEDEWLEEIREFATQAMMEMIRGDLAALGVQMDVYSSEKALYGTGRIEDAIARLESQGLIYRGVLEPPKGKLPEDWEAREQLLFRSSAHGDDVDRPIQKSDGAWTYFAPDIAYHWDKIDRGFDQLIDVFGADHGGYVKRMNAAVKALSNGRVPLDVKLIQLVKLYKNGEPFKMSKRAGTFVTLRDVVEEAGADVTRFIMLTRKNDAALDFDFAKVLEQSKDNPVCYVQYAQRRVNSVLRRPPRPGSRWTIRPWRPPICRFWPIRPSWSWPARSPNGRVWSNMPPARMSPIASPSSSMRSPLTCIPFGIAAMMTIPCASCRMAMLQPAKEKLHWSGRLALLFHAVWVFLASLLQKKCADERCRCGTC